MEPDLLSVIGGRLVTRQRERPRRPRPALKLAPRSDSDSGGYSGHPVDRA